jgi:hypothetical protein
MRSVEAFSQSFTNHSAAPLALLSSAVVLTLPSVRGVTWVASEQNKP